MGTLDLSTLKQELEAAIRSGRSHEVRAKLFGLNTADLPRTEYSAFAGFARRAGAPSWALRLLKPVIHSQGNQLQAPATAPEIASYALALSATGALSEARKLIQQIESVVSHETLLAGAYVSIWGWEYARAIEFFKRYLEIPGLTDFQIALAQLNLAGSHEFVGHKLKAGNLVTQILPAARKMKWALIERDALSLSAQLHITHREWGLARSALVEASKVSLAAGLDALLIDKWKTVLSLHEHPKSSASAEAVEKLCEKARHSQRWEIERDAEYHLAVIRKDENALNRLYFGTPFASFRKRLILAAKDYWTPDSQYIWRPAGTPGTLTLDIVTGELRGAVSSSLNNDLCLRLIQILASDFYRPFKRGGLFSELYPDKHYDVSNAAHTTANVIQRLRKAMHASGVPLAIEYANRLYRLKASTPIDILILNPDGSKAQIPDSRQSLLRSLKEKWPYQAFTANQAAEYLSMPETKVRKLMRQAVGDQKIFAIGNTRSRQYRFREKAAA